MRLLVESGDSMSIRNTPDCSTTVAVAGAALVVATIASSINRSAAEADEGDRATATVLLSELVGGAWARTRPGGRGSGSAMAVANDDEIDDVAK